MTAPANVPVDVLAIVADLQQQVDDLTGVVEAQQRTLSDLTLVVQSQDYALSQLLARNPPLSTTTTRPSVLTSPTSLGGV